jgi:hypothetical protein
LLVHSPIKKANGFFQRFLVLHEREKKMVVGAYYRYSFPAWITHCDKQWQRHSPVHLYLVLTNYISLNADEERANS